MSLDDRYRFIGKKMYIAKIAKVLEVASYTDIQV